MKKKMVVSLMSGSLMFIAVDPSSAALITIGTATYNGSDYNLIWDDNNNGNSVVWLDYSNLPDDWAGQNAWAAGLNSSLIYNINAAYDVSWSEDAWRLGSTVDGPYQYGYDGTTTAGYNIINSEMGHLFYEELSNLGFYDTSGSYQLGYGLQNAGDFDNLIAGMYWSGTEYAFFPGVAWFFGMSNGNQANEFQWYNSYGLAVRNAQITPTPTPGAIWLLGSGIAGLIGNRLRKRKIEIKTEI